MNITCRAVKSSSGWSRGCLLCLRFIIALFFLGSVDSDLDNDGTAADFFTLEELNGFLLLLLVSYVNKAIAFALPGTTVSPAYNTGRGNINTCLGEEGRERGFVNIETEIGDKEYGLRRLSNGILPRGARRTLNPGPTEVGLRAFGRPFGLRGVGGDRGLTFSLNLRLALRIYERLYAARDGLGHTETFFFRLLILRGPVAAGSMASSGLGASPLASASVTSPGTALLPRLPGLLLAFLSFFSLFFWSEGLAISTIT
jgi:hypothetical protein